MKNLKTKLKKSKHKSSNKEFDKHLAEATKAGVAGLKKHKRATILSCTGSGKTDIAMRIAAGLPAKKIVILVPTLLLVEQTVRRWQRDWAHQEQMNVLLVCSESMRTQDDPKDIGETLLRGKYEASTDPKRVAAFLSSTGYQIVIGTYQSAKMLRQAKMIDLVIFDEAHLTVGHRDKSFSFAVSDENVKATHRLFMTATPREVLSSTDSEFVYSMGDERVYGPVVYKLTHRAAAARGIVVPFDVLIQVVKDEEISVLLAKNKKLQLTQNGWIDMRMLAAKEAFDKALKQYPIKHPLVQLSTRGRIINWCSLFSTDKMRGVDGTMSRAVIEDELRWHKHCTCQGGVAYCQVLGIGWDQPETDAICFVDPKSSKINICQACGRITRWLPGKKKGYVIVAVPASPDAEDLEGRWSEVGRVLRGLCEMDEFLIDDFRAAARAKSKQKKGPQRYGRIVLDGLDGLMESMRKTVEVSLWKAVGVDWWDRAATVKKRLESGESLSSMKESDGKWVCKQRTERKRGRLSQEQVTYLEQISGWRWQVNGLECNKAHDFFDVNGRWPCNGESGYAILATDIYKFKKGHLSEERQLEYFLRDPRWFKTLGRPSRRRTEAWALLFQDKKVPSDREDRKRHQRQYWGRKTALKDLTSTNALRREAGAEFVLFQAGIGATWYTKAELNRAKKILSESQT